MNSDSLADEHAAIWAKLPSVSVIVLNYNTVEYLSDCFQALQHLIYPPSKLELILVDNASTDQSLHYAQEHLTEVRIIKNKQNYGFSRGNNIGVEKAKGEVVAFLNPDMRVDQQWLIELVKPLLSDQTIVAVGSKILSWDGQTIDFAGSAANFYGYGYQTGFGQPVSENTAALAPILFACGGAMLIKRHIFLEAGGFDEDFFAYYEDLDLGWRLWVLGYQVFLAPDSLAYHVHHGSWGKVNQEKKRVLYERNAFFTALKNYDDKYFNQIQPVALLLLIKRIYLAMGVDDSLFRLEERKPQQAERSALASAQIGPVYDTRYYLKTMWQTLRNDGLARLWLKVQTEIKRRYWAWQGAKRPGKMRLSGQASPKATVPLQALSYAVAGNDIITLYEKMLGKRAKIQAQRCRSDQEIFKLFGRPLDFSEPWPEYKDTQQYLSRLFEIDQIFAG